MVEAEAAVTYPGHRILNGSDSQVTLGAVLRGRSSSPVLNDELRQSIPTLVGGGLASGGFWIDTHDNVADDPTRHMASREPPDLPPPWLIDA